MMPPPSRVPSSSACGGGGTGATVAPPSASGGGGSVFAGSRVFVSRNDAAGPAVVAMGKLNVPTSRVAMPKASNAPLPSVLAEISESDADGPVAGGANVTSTPLTPFPLASVRRTRSFCG